MSIAASAVLPSLPVSGLRQPAFGVSAPGKSRSGQAPLREPAAQVPARKWPFPPEPQSTAAQPPVFRPASSLGDVRKLSSSQIVSRKDMLLDVLMVVAWGIAIPALMWLGAVAGF
ncbi:hypothetical protein [Bordetella sp. FB-8]|uniref:hypothetical protein n=1 Tax=Bordetella sp. FB-8 TaxID=1159870 RepID=UPI00037219EB|nr:hypothetical protein [Bordetella sp. FB-8]